MQRLHVDGFKFDFPDDWSVGRYDEWRFYRDNVQKVVEGFKATDVIARSPDGTAYFIEVKDYRLFPRAKDQPLDEECAIKFLSTLAGLLPAKLSANIADEKVVAANVLSAQRLRFVLHLEQPMSKSKLRPRGDFNLVDLQQKLRQRLRHVSAKPRVAAMNRMYDLVWSVSE